MLETWKSLLLSAGNLTKVGISLLRAQEIPDAESRVFHFLSKSTATLQARSSSLLRYVRWRTFAGRHGSRGFPGEKDAYMSAFSKQKVRPSLSSTL